MDEQKLRKMISDNIDRNIDGMLFKSLGVETTTASNVPQATLTKDSLMKAIKDLSAEMKRMEVKYIAKTLHSGPIIKAIFPDGSTRFEMNFDQLAELHQTHTMKLKRIINVWDAEFVPAPVWGYHSDVLPMPPYFATLLKSELTDNAL